MPNLLSPCSGQPFAVTALSGTAFGLDALPSSGYVAQVPGKTWINVTPGPGAANASWDDRVQRESRKAR